MESTHLIGCGAEQCPICGGTAHRVAESVPGYQKGRTFNIYECEVCFVSFAQPLAADSELYGHIYRNIEQVPGYNRYCRYAHEVLIRKKPLDYLCSQEESYWAVARHVRARRAAGRSFKILEVGCGMGYFTYALAKDGFLVTGVDISPQAVSWARERYGPYYETASLRDLWSRGPRYDVIIMNQLIEHVPDVHGFVSEAVRLLSPGGELVITTPNKSVWPGVEWETELPPVHLLWFGEDALRHLGNRCNCDTTFIDFSPFYEFFPTMKVKPKPLRERRNFFDTHGTLILKQSLSSVTWWRRMLEDTGAMIVMQRIYAAVLHSDMWRGARGPILAAVLKPREKNERM